MKEECRTSQEWFRMIPFGCGTRAALVLLLAFAAQAAIASEPNVVESYRKDIKPILTKYCFDCHADGVRKGNVSFDNFESDDELTGKRELWHAVLKNTRATPATTAALGSGFCSGRRSR